MPRSKSLMALRLWLRYRSSRSVMSQLNDRMLYIGLTRSGIGCAAHIHPVRLWEDYGL